MARTSAGDLLRAARCGACGGKCASATRPAAGCCNCAWRAISESCEPCLRRRDLSPTQDAARRALLAEWHGQVRLWEHGSFAGEDGAAARVGGEAVAIPLDTLEHLVVLLLGDTRRLREELRGARGELEFLVGTRYADL